MAPWFKAKDVATILGYENTREAVIDNVDDDDKERLSNLNIFKGSCELPSTEVALRGNEGNTVYVNESGLYSLILRSQKPEAKAFKTWVTREVLPSIRKAGYMSAQQALGLGLSTENSLHFRVIRFIRARFPDAILAPCLGELQDTNDKRLEAYKKGYQKGTPDILLLNHHKKHSGLAIELKNPMGTGKISEAQQDRLGSYARANYKTLVSCDYDDILVTLIDYFADIRICCPCCKRKFKSEAALAQHLKFFHKH